MKMTRRLGPQTKLSSAGEAPWVRSSEGPFPIPQQHEDAGFFGSSWPLMRPRDDAKTVITSLRRRRGNLSIFISEHSIFVNFMDPSDSLLTQLAEG